MAALDRGPRLRPLIQLRFSDDAPPIRTVVAESPPAHQRLDALSRDADEFRRLHRIVRTLETRISSHERLCAERSAEDAGRAKADAEARERWRNVFAGLSALIGLVALFLSLSR